MAIKIRKSPEEDADIWVVYRNGEAVDFIASSIWASDKSFAGYRLFGFCFDLTEKELDSIWNWIHRRDWWRYEREIIDDVVASTAPLNTSRRR